MSRIAGPVSAGAPRVRREYERAAALWSMGGLILSAGLALNGCVTDPIADDGLEPAYATVVSGDVVLLGPLEEAHRVIVFLSPVIVSSSGVSTLDPINLAVVPADALSESPSEEGYYARTGPYVFSNVPAGQYVVSGLLDMDDNFNPLVPELAGPSAGDVPGAYIDLSTGLPRILSVEGGQPADEVTVLFSW